ncbi:MAG: hypothetical protein K9M03_03825 [Kiritimatiellales bacterium]|nr:hypothetical protein [Kiritimatiellales bacterium]
MIFRFHTGKFGAECCDKYPIEYSSISSYLEEYTYHVDSCEEELERIDNAKHENFIGDGNSGNSVYSEFDKDGLYISHLIVESSPDNFLNLEDAEYLLKEWKAFLEDKKERTFELNVEVIEAKDKRDTNPNIHRDVC